MSSSSAPSSSSASTRTSFDSTASSSSSSTSTSRCKSFGVGLLQGEEETEKADRLIKIVIIGSNENLKSALQTRLAYIPSNSFTFGAQTSNYETSFGRDFRVRHLMVDGGVRVRVEIWRDGPPPKPSHQYQNNQSLGSAAPAWADAHAVIYVHDEGLQRQSTTSDVQRSTIDKIEASAAEYQLASVQRDRPHLPKSCIIDTGSSNNNTRISIVDDDDLNMLSDALKMDCFHVSVHDGHGIERMLLSVVRSALEYKWDHRELIARYADELKQLEQAAAAWKSARAARLRSQSKRCCQPSSKRSFSLSTASLFTTPRQDCEIQ